MIIRFLRFFFGYINFRAYGGFSDRFLNLCTRDAIPLWNIKNVKGNISASTTIEGYLSIRKPARKSGMKVICLEKKGLIFFMKKNKVRVGLLAGLIFCAGVTFLLSQFVWSVSLVGNISLEEDYILESFARHGIKVGVPISSLDETDAVSLVQSEIDELSWAAVNRKGTTVVIEVRERTAEPEMYDSETPTNLIASEDGVIVSIDALYGNEEVKPGSAVTKGDLLISGIITLADGTENTIHADGYVKALVKREKAFTGNEYEIFAQTKEKTRKSLFFFGVTIPLGRAVPQTFFTEHKSFVESRNTLLPVGYVTEYGAEYADQIEQPDACVQEKIALWQNACYVRELLGFSEIRNSSVKRNETGGKTKFVFSGECMQEIGVLQEIYVEKSDDNT